MVLSTFMVLSSFMVLSPFMVLSSFIYFYPPYFFCKVNANERNGKEILSFYLLRPMISIIFISIFQPSLYLPSCHLYIYLPSLSEVVFTTSLHPHQEPAATFAPFSYIKNGAASRLNTPRCLILYISNPRNHSLYIKSEIKNTPLYISSEIKIILYISLPRIKIILYIFIPRAKKPPSSHLLLRHKSFPSLVIIEDANLGNFPFRFVSYFDSRLRIIIWCTINTLSSLKQSAIILWGRRGT